MDKTLLTKNRLFLLLLLCHFNSYGQGNLFFSEYIEGQGGCCNKCLELFNPTASTLNLSNYSIAFYNNGNSDAGNASFSIASRVSTPTLGPFGILVLCQGNADIGLQSVSNGSFGFGNFNGDDAIALLQNGTPIDVIGGIGCDPGDAWTVGGNTTKDNTLVRNACTRSGNASGCGFGSLGTEWSSIGTNNFSDLGSYSGSAPKVTIDGPNALCQNLSITLSATGGYADYRWSNGSRESTITVTSGGWYTVTVTNAAGCQTEVSKRVNGQSPQIFADITNIQDVSCKPKKDGGFRVIPSGGSPGFTFSWESGSGTDQDIRGLGAGTYTVTVTDNNGCTVTETATIDGIATRPMMVRTTSETCHEFKDGMINLSASGGNLEYSINGEDYFPSGNFEDLWPGTYTVSVRDETGCGDQQTTIVDNGSYFHLKRSIITQEKCQGISGGQIILRPQGGKAPFSVSFDGKPFVQSLTFSDLDPGTFEVILRDNSGCARTFEQQIEEGSDMIVTGVNTSPATCEGIDNGGVIFNVTGGSGNVSFNKIEADGVLRPRKDSIYADLAIGWHNVIIRDNKFDCQIPIDFHIPAAFSLSTNIVNPPPCGADEQGTITILPQNGTPPYQYSLDSNAFVESNIFTDLTPQAYVLTTQDAEGCVSIDSVDFGSADQFEIVFTVAKDESCIGIEDGQITVATNSTNEVEYSLDGINYTTNNVFSGLVPNDYIVYAQAGACKDTATVTIAAATNIAIKEMIPEIALCEGDNDGQLTIIAEGGKAPYTYKLAEEEFQSSNVFTNLLQGVYSVTIRDSNKCEQLFKDIILPGPVRLDTECAVAQHVTTPDGFEGMANLIIFGGASPYNVQLVAAGFNNVLSLDGQVSFNNLAVGDYVIEITDDNGCKNNCSFTIEAHLCNFEVVANHTNVTCFGGLDGTISLELPASLAPFIINWSDTINNGLQELPNLGAGLYQVTVQDVNECVDSLEIMITEPAPLSVAIRMDNTTICEKDSVLLSVPAIFDNYTWSTKDTTAEQTVFESGNYSVTVMDENDCLAMDEIVITVIVQDTFYDTRFTCEEANVGTFAIEERGADGCMNVVFRTFELVAKDTTNIALATCDPTEVGIFYSSLINQFGCDSLVITTIIANTSEQTELTATTCNPANVRTDTFNFTNQFLCDSLVIINTTLVPKDLFLLTQISCNPQDTGVTTQYLINQFGCDSIIETTTNLIPINNCQLDFSLETDSICWDALTGTIQVKVDLGAPPFDYYILNDFWKDTVQTGILAASEGILTDIPIGRYIVGLKNKQHIQDEQRIAIMQAPKFNINGILSDYNGFEISCAGEADGSIQLQIEGGKAPYTYAWESGEVAPNLQGLETGSYEVTVTDANACTNSTIFDLLNSNELTIDFQSYSPICSDAAAGRIIINDILNVNGQAEYSLDGILFQPIGDLPFTVDQLIPGDHQLFIQDENDCQASADFTIPEKIDYQLTLGNDQQLHLGDSLSIIPKANFDIIRYEWTATIPLTCPECATINTIPSQNGTYTLTAYDINDCSASASITITLQKESQVYLPNVFSPNGDGLNDQYQIFMGKSVAAINLLRIFDYEGRLMYQVHNRLANDASIGWDGRFKGEKMLPSVFVVLVEVALLDGSTREYSQTMTLIE